MMAKKQNKTRAQKGFTLVEVIVVAVIVLIISAVAIPMYNGYVRGARQDTVNNLAETAAAAANALWRKTGNNAAAGEPAHPALANNAEIKAHTAPFNLHFDENKHTVFVRGNNIEVTETGDAADPIRAAVPFRQ